MPLTDPCSKSEFVGVWGRQTISHFKRVLRQRGADLVVVRAHAHDRVPKSCTQYYCKVGQ
jgi:hypothetical protein